MTARDQQLREAHRKVARLARQLTSHGETIARTLIARQPGDPVEIPRGHGTGPRTETSSTTEAASLDYEHAQQRDARLLGRLLYGDRDIVELRGLWAARQIAAALDNPLPTSYPIQLDGAATELPLITIVSAVRRGNPLAADWRAAVEALGLAWHLAATQIHDGWQLIYGDVWRETEVVVADRTITDYAPDDRLTEHLLLWTGRIDKLARRLDALRRRVTRAHLTPCRNHEHGCPYPARHDNEGTAQDRLCIHCARTCTCNDPDEPDICPTRPCTVCSRPIRLHRRRTTCDTCTRQAAGARER